MKKYQRLLLLIISVVSLTLFLIYRHEYNRLHYILEVFNFFGQPCNLSELRASSDILNNHDWGPLPVWQQTENIHVYSAFWTNKNEAKVIVLHTNRSENVRSCYLWFEDVEKPIVGLFRYSKIENRADATNILYYYCSISTILYNYPYAVSFVKKNKKELSKILLTNNLDSKPSFNITICVSPDNFNKSSIVEFLSFHELLGINSFVFYGGNIPHGFKKLLSGFSRSLGLHVTFFPWNFPLKNDNLLNREIISAECLLRNKNQSKHVVVLESNEFIVPSSDFGILVEEFHPQSQKYGLPVETFCIVNSEAQKPIPLQNIKAITVDKKEKVDVRFIYRIEETDDVVSVQQSDKSYAAVHKYIYCSEIPPRKYRDDSILKYSADFTKSTLFQLFLNKRL